LAVPRPRAPAEIALEVRTAVDAVREAGEIVRAQRDYCVARVTLAWAAGRLPGGSELVVPERVEE
jgi:hypothetical protein